MNVSLQQQHKSAGHSLLELVLSLVLLSIIFVSVGSAVIFASSASPGDDSFEVTMAADSRVISQIAEDLAVARYFIEKTDTSVTFVVSDRDGDGSPDRIRYAWAGIDGGPLTYQLNDLEPENLLDSVALFDLMYTEKASTKTLPRAAGGSGEEKVIAQFSYVGTGYTKPINSSNALGQVIKPSLSSGSSGFVPTRLVFYGSTSGDASGLSLFELRNRSGATPGTQVFGSALVDEATLPGTTEAYEITWSNTSLITPDQDIAVYVNYVSGANKVLDLYGEGVIQLLTGPGGSIGSTDGGATWQMDNNYSFAYKLFGVESLPETKQYTVEQVRTTSMTVQLQSVAKQRSPLTRRVRLILAPPNTDTFAETDFDADPTSMDLNADGYPDWALEAGTFQASTLANSIWTSDGPLSFKPDGLSLAKVIRVNARMRSNDTLGPAIHGPYTINSSGEGLPIITQLRDNGSGGQELAVYNGFALSDPSVRIVGLPAGLIDIGLTVIPEADLLYVEVNHQPAACLLLSRVADPGDVVQGVELRSSGGIAEFDSVRIRVGGSYTFEEADGDGLILDTFDLLF